MNGKLKCSEIEKFIWMCNEYEIRCRSMRICNKCECGNEYECVTKLKVRCQGSFHLVGDIWLQSL